MDALIYEIPKASEAWTALAIGYLGDPTQLPESLRERDLRPRQRKPQREFVFGSKWGKGSSIVS